MFSYWQSEHPDNTPVKIEDGLFIGSYAAERNKQALQAAGITHVLQVANDVRPSHPNDFKYLHIAVNDMAHVDLTSHFNNAFAFIDDAMQQQGGNVLVHCLAGISRSATICIAWLMQKHRIGFEEANKRVAAVRPFIMPNRGFTLQLQHFERMGFDPAACKGWRESSTHDAPVWMKALVQPPPPSATAPAEWA